MARYYGCIPEKFDEKDYIKVYQPIKRSEKIVAGRQNATQQKSLKGYVSQVYDQGQMNSCTANALCAAYSVDRNKQNKSLRFDPSRLFLYYNTCHLRKETDEDSGATIRDAINAFEESGICEESLWPYHKEKLMLKPDQSAYDKAKGIITHRERLIPDVQTFKNWLDSGHPFVFGFSVYERCFDEAGRKGHLPLPTQEERSKAPDGYHAVMAVEYNDEENAFLILNSYGNEWGKDGYFYMPYTFITDDKMCFNFWTITFDPDSSKQTAQTVASIPNSSNQSAQGSSWFPLLPVVLFTIVIYWALTFINALKLM